MSSHVPFAVRMIAEVWRLFAYPLRGFYLACGADPGACLAFSVLVITVLLTLPMAARAVIVTERRIARRVAAHRERRELEAVAARIEQLYDPADVHDGDTQIMPGFTHLGPTVPLTTRELQRELHRRSRRFPGRRSRRPQTTSFDRRQ